MQISWRSSSVLLDPETKGTTNFCKNNQIFLKFKKKLQLPYLFFYPEVPSFPPQKFSSGQVFHICWNVWLLNICYSLKFLLTLTVLKMQQIVPITLKQTIITLF